MNSILSTMLDDEESEVIIVGGGLSGLMAATVLARAAPNMVVSIVEAGAAFGGHLHSTAFGELGAKWVLARHHHEIINLLHELNIGTEKLEGEQWGAMHRNKTDQFNSISAFELCRFIHEIDTLCRDYDPKM